MMQSSPELAGVVTAKHTVLATLASELVLTMAGIFFINSSPHFCTSGVGRELRTVATAKEDVTDQAHRVVKLDINLVTRRQHKQLLHVSEQGALFA